MVVIMEDNKEEEEETSIRALGCTEEVENVRVVMEMEKVVAATVVAAEEEEGLEGGLQLLWRLWTGSCIIHTAGELPKRLCLLWKSE